jgi:uncharacterized protein involved in exopolysaccharide biosynthesis
MENYSSQSLSYNHNKNYGISLIQPQPAPWIEQQEEDWNLQEFIGIVRRRMGVIAVAAAIVMAGFIISAFNKKPDYESSFQLLVEPVNNDTKVLDLFKDPNLAKSSLDYDSQIQVLKSPEVMGKVVRQLQSSYLSSCTSPYKPR